MNEIHKFVNDYTNCRKGEKMYRVTVTTRVLNDKDTLHLSAPILVWMVLFFIIFGVMCITDISFLVLPMFLEFLCFIPVTIWSIKKARKLRQESFVKIDVMLTARDGRLYKDDMKLNVSYSERDNEVYLDDMHDAGKYNHHHITFFATISGDEVGGFIAFCRENNVQVEV